MNPEEKNVSIAGIAFISRGELTDEYKTMVMKQADQMASEAIEKGEMTADELKYVLAVALICRDFFGRRKIELLTLNRMNSLKDPNPTGQEDIIMISKKMLSEQEKQMVREKVREELDVRASEGKVTEEDRERTMVIVYVDRKFMGGLTTKSVTYCRETMLNPDAIIDHHES